MHRFWKRVHRQAWGDARQYVRSRLGYAVFLLVLLAAVVFAVKFFGTSDGWIDDLIGAIIWVAALILVFGWIYGRNFVRIAPRLYERMAKRWREAETKVERVNANSASPFMISLSQTYADVRGNEFIWHTPITVRNASTVSSFEGVEVHLISAKQMQPEVGSTHAINRRLIERNTGLPSFGLTPRMQRDVFFLRLAPDKEKGHRLKIGPLERINGQELSYGPGLHKIDVAIYGRDAEPAFESLAIGLDASGTMMYGAWRDDLPWPSMRITSTVTEVPPPQSPQGIPEKTQP